MPDTSHARPDMRYRLALALTGIIAAAIAALMLTPVTAPEIVGRGSDKIYHLIAFGALTFPSAMLAPRLCGPMLAFAIIFGGVIEIIQPNLGRSGEWGDFLADAAGALIGLSSGLLAGRFLASTTR